ncbi:MAG: ArsA-related P-loop ATPase [Chloroflexota bacterium]
MRIIIFSGKGGCGSSTLAAGTACLLAKAGQHTLAFGLERGLGAALAVELTSEPLEAGERLDALEGHGGLGAQDEFREWLQQLLDWRGMDADLAEDLGTLPGISHIGRLLELEALISSGAYDAAVIDAPGLAQFLDLPSALDSAARWLDKLFAPRQSSLFESVAKAFAGDYAANGEAVFDRGRELLGRLAALRDMLTDPSVTSARIVVGADTASSDIAREALSVLGLFSYTVDAIFVGPLVPRSIDLEFFAAHRKEQDATLAKLASLAPAPPLVEADMQPKAPRGVMALGAYARAVYGEADPAAFFAQASEHNIEPDAGGHLLRVHVPFARREDLRLEEMDDGIAVHLNGRRCVLLLPDTDYKEATAWTYEDGVLAVSLSS